MPVPLGSAPPLSRSASKPPSASPSTSRPRGLSSLFWRGFWVALGLLFAFQSLEAELALSRLFDGQYHRAGEWKAAGVEALLAFPFDRHIRNSALAMIEAADSRK